MPNKALIETISAIDSKMRSKARMICGDKNLGDDIWHDAVLKVLTTYDCREVDDINIPGLLYSTIISSFIDNKRKNGMTDKCVELKYAEQEIINSDNSIYDKFVIGDVLKFLDSINQLHRDIFLMSVFGMDNASIAIILGESNENVRKVIFRVRSKIKHTFKNERNNF